MTIRNKGFLLLEVLISALIIAGSISAAFYLFRMGFEYLQRAEESSKIAGKIPQVVSYITNVADLEKGEGEVHLGEDIKLKWRSELVEVSRPQVPLPEAGFISPYELYLYEVHFSIISKKTYREYVMKVCRYKMLFTPDFEGI